MSGSTRVNRRAIPVTVLVLLLVAGLPGAARVGPALAARPEEDAGPQPATGYACDGSDGVYVYDDADWAGACIRYTADDPEFGDDNFHDVASSIKFVGFMYAGGRARATLYEHAYYSGASTTYNGDDNWLGDDPIGNDRADAIRIEIRPFCDLVSQIPKAECEALVAFYNSTFGPYWTHRDGWVTNYTPCSWYGVTCSGGHVTGLHLPENNLAGSLRETLGDLAQLERLDLDMNQLTGPIPPHPGQPVFLV